ncbi:hypothetical protein GCM10010170_024650 [Dactylosporangium salmoneum]|uniref:Uncharacterized protein n=1 Tax=Dactylosporangium salmoneum TaxID=53361 RepID=A0ABN3FZZ4_9ACTN
MTASTHIHRPTVTEMSQSEWNDAVERTLKRLHLTYDQLRDMGHQRSFTSLAAKKLWLAIREQEGRCSLPAD